MGLSRRSPLAASGGTRLAVVEPPGLASPGPEVREEDQGRGLASLDGWRIVFCGADGTRRDEPFGAETACLPLEEAAPARAMGSWRGGRGFGGLWWSATSARHVAFRSWAQRDQAMALDFDPEVAGFATQPFVLSWPGRRGRSYVPDFFARLRDGQGVVADAREGEPSDDRSEVLRAARAACEAVGWRYRLLSPLDPLWVANLAWLAGYRHPRHHRSEVVTALLEAFARPRGLMAGAASVGDPIAVLPVAYHLCWAHRLKVDLGRPLTEASVVYRDRA